MNIAYQDTSPETEFFDVLGVKLEAVRYGGDETNPTLVFLHEGLGCIEMWRDFPGKLSKKTGCPALVYSRQGYGQSDNCLAPRPLTYMHIEAQKVLPEVLNLSGIKKHFLIGHSDGGSISLINAGSCCTSGLLGVITMAAHVFCEELTVTSIQEAEIAYHTGELRKGLSRYHKDVDGTFWGWCKAWLSPEFMQWNLEEWLPEIVVPQLVIQGVNDPYGTALQVETIKRKSSGSVDVVMLEDCQHWPYREQPVICLSAMAEFIKRLV